MKKNKTTNGLYEIHETKPSEKNGIWKIEYKIIYKQDSSVVSAGDIEGNSALNALTMLQLEVTHLTQMHTRSL